ncbi:MAG TPA: electron transfer flavoprotein subunit alpha/FixB family protein [Peptococcaceae bacterium]|nr:electron transfer flavoprotein subunit alpha/FixB family protein [Peptococcaceae bacterium]
MGGTFVVYSDKPQLVLELIGFCTGAGRKAVALAFDAAVAEECAAKGADKVLFFNSGINLPEAYCQQVAEAITGEGAEGFIVGSTVRGREMAAKVAALLNWPLASDVSRVVAGGGELEIERLTYGGAVVQQEKVRLPAVVTVPPGKFEPSSKPKAGAEVVALSAEPDGRYTLLERTRIERQGADLANADKIVCAGMGFAKKEDLKLAFDLAAVLGAEVACTRSVAEERKWLPPDVYVGISGATVKPRLYLTLGVSGQVQHIVGARDSGLIVAVDVNENAPIFSAADYGIVGDLYEVVPTLIDALKNA